VRDCLYINDIAVNLITRFLITADKNKFNDFFLIAQVIY
jgi:hypothetical protein